MKQNSDDQTKQISFYFSLPKQSDWLKMENNPQITNQEISKIATQVPKLISFSMHP